MITNLKLLRTEMGISQQQLADKIMVSQQSVNKYENHGVEPDINTLIRIADYFNVSIDFLVGRVDIRESVTKLSSSDLSNNEVDLIKAFQGLTPAQQMHLTTFLVSLQSPKK